jgi:pimeloyl-[acyl-carrier protein] methyl ester esterase
MSLSLSVKKNSLVFLPGWGFKASIWSRLIEKLSENKTRQYSIPTLIGWSLGGLRAIQRCHQFPDRYKKLILVSSLPKFVSSPEDNWTGISPDYALRFHTQAQTNIARLIPSFLRLVQYPDTSASLSAYLKDHLLDIHKPAHKNYLKRSLDWLLHSDLRKYYQNLSVPIIHIMGSQDAIMTYNQHSINQLRGKDTVIYTIPDAGHIPFLSHPELFIDILNETLDDRHS